MKHAGGAALDALDDLLGAIRARCTAAGVKEKQRGVFYRKGRAWLHFHEDPAGLFADLRAGADWVRFPVSQPAARAKLVAAVERALRRRQG
jgi:hypothetical protein